MEPTVSDFSHCHRCGRKLRDAYFCRQCGRCFCCCQCMEQHTAQGCKTSAQRTTSLKDELPNLVTNVSYA